MNERDRVVTILQDLDLPRGQYAIAGSGALVLRNIKRTKPMGDLDIFLATRPWISMASNTPSNGFAIFTTDPNDRKRRSDPPYLFQTFYGLEVNIFSEWRKRGIGDINVAQWIYAAEEVDGWPAIRLDFLLDWKRSVGRDKDRDDIVVLERVLGA